MNQAWYMWEGVLSEQQIQSIINECEYYNIETAKVGVGEAGNSNTDIRKSEVRWIDQNDTNSRFIANLIWNYVIDANRVAFGCDIRQIGDIQYTTYTGQDGGFYDWHIDSWIDQSINMFDRKLSVTVQLSDSDDYEGGDFELSCLHQPDVKKLRKKGTILVFPSFSRHRVTPLTKGTRKSLVAWIEGPKWK
jgi:PKHD-type hydroxylase